MAKYAPQSLPMGAARQSSDNTQHNEQPQRGTAAQPAIQLGQYVRREMGMQGVRAYTNAIREFLPQSDYQAICKTLGVPANASAQPTMAQPSTAQRTSAQPTSAQPTMAQPSTAQPTTAQQNPVNQMQMMQMLTQLMGQQGGMGQSAAAGGANAGGGINPMLLAQLLGGMNG